MIKAKVEQLADIVTGKNIDISFIHHSGHQVDGSDFTRWNSTVDFMCGAVTTFGKLTVVERWSQRSSGGAYRKMCRCRCECGREKLVRYSSLRRGDVKSCGCASRANHYRLTPGEAYLNKLTSQTLRP
jgi:hypothetical protein